MKTFSVQTIGCKVNHYEGEQLIELLRARGLVQAAGAERADLRVVHTCSVTVQAASKSRQVVRRATRLPVRGEPAGGSPVDGAPCDHCKSHSSTGHASVNLATGRSTALPILANRNPSTSPAAPPPGGISRPRVVVTGCWATSDPREAASLPGVDAVLGHGDDIAAGLDRLLARWQDDARPAQAIQALCEPPWEPAADDGWINEAGTPAGELTGLSKARIAIPVNEIPSAVYAGGAAAPAPVGAAAKAGFAALPVLGQRRQDGRQRAFLKVQDGCDAHCTYCIIPKLRPRLWSKPVDAAVNEARNLVAAGHVELVLTGIFLGAYGQPTALRRRQPAATGGRETPLAELVRALCTRVPALGRLRLSSLEPGDMTPDLVAVLRDHPQVVPHFHLPLQSGSDRLLRQMNRQYTHDDFLFMVDRVRAAFDRPALTTDVIVGFPGESDAEFDQTVGVVNHAAFIHVHAFSFSPRPGTAAARWGRQFVRGPVVNERIGRLRTLAASHDLAFRRQFLGETVELLIERDPEREADHAAPNVSPASNPVRYAARHHGRCERYFDVSVANAPDLSPGDFVRARVMHVSPDATLAEVVR